MSLLEVKDINMNYHSVKGVTEAIKDVSFNVEKGEFVSIIGPSGCGKSTLLNIISGLLKPSSGTIVFNDNKSSDNLDKMGYMFQRDYLFPWLTVKENVLLGLKIKNKITKESLVWVDSLIDNYGLKNFVNHKPGELSGGMRQRVALIRTLSLNPEVILLDEPFSALDYQTRQKATDDVYEIMRREGKTAIMVTHDLGEAIIMSDRVMVLTKALQQLKGKL